MGLIVRRSCGAWLPWRMRHRSPQCRIRGDLSESTQGVAPASDRAAAHRGAAFFHGGAPAGHREAADGLDNEDGHGCEGLERPPTSGPSTCAAATAVP